MKRKHVRTKRAEAELMWMVVDGDGVLQASCGISRDKLMADVQCLLAITSGMVPPLPPNVPNPRGFRVIRVKVEEVDRVR